MVYPPQEVCSSGPEAIQQFLCKGKARQPASLAPQAPMAPVAAPDQPRLGQRQTEEAKQIITQGNIITGHVYKSGAFRRFRVGLSEKVAQRKPE